ncbi:hemolysin family protein [Prosthecomicrobium sp. N25]|uniref:hemolysin family protein n=1 Tax=Prosthecomicrobium sp. N25 TaxID=3129254 RepID=UPI003076ED7F
MSDIQNTGQNGGSPAHDGGEGREGDSRSGESWIDRLMTAVGLKPSTASLRDHLETVLETEAAGDATFTPEERAMIRNILRLRETRVEDVMVPRSEITAIAADVTLTELMLAFKESGHSRMPVYRESLDDASGMVHIRDLMGHIAEEATVRASLVETREERSAGIYLTQVDLSRRLEDAGLIRPVLFVPASMPATDLLARMQANRIQIALVIDEFGGVDGLVSLEDIVETVVGDIEDEHDIAEEAADVVPAGEGTWIVDGLVELDDVAAATGIRFEGEALPEDVETIGGLVFALAGRMPAIGEVVRSEKLPGVALEVLDADSRRVKRLRVSGMAARPDDLTLRRLGAA